METFRNNLRGISKSVKRRLPILFSIILLGILIVWIDPRKLVRILASADLLWILAALALATGNRVFMALKWNMLLRARSLQVGWMEAIRAYYVSTFLGVFLPPTVGADIARTVMLRRGKVPLVEVAASIVVERVLGLLSLLVFGMVACVVFLSIMRENTLPVGELLRITIVVVAIATVLFLVSFSGWFSNAVARMISWLGSIRKIRKYADKLRKLYDAYREYRRHKAALLLFFILTCVENALPIIRAWMIARALHVHIGVDLFLVIVPIELLVIRLPFTFDGFGVREGLFAYFLSTFAGVDNTLAFTIGLANHLLFLVALIPGALMWMMPGAGARRQLEPDLALTPQTTSKGEQS